MITLYSKPGCPGCRMSKRFMEANKIDFVELDVSVDADALARVRELGWSALPVVETATADSWSGHCPDKLQTLLGAAS